MPRTTTPLRSVLFGLALLSIPTVAEAQASRTIVGTPHDFSAITGPGTDGCSMCHLPNTAPGNKGGGEDFEAYALVAGPGVPSMGQETQVCLSCHDGMGSAASVAFGLGPGQGSHPTSVEYGSFLSDDLRHESEVESRGVKLHGGSGTARMECTSCHNPHDNSNGKFLRIPNRGSALCLACHSK